MREFKNPQPRAAAEEYLEAAEERLDALREAPWGEPFFWMLMHLSVRVGAPPLEMVAHYMRSGVLPLAALITEKDLLDYITKYIGDINTDHEPTFAERVRALNVVFREVRRRLHLLDKCLPEIFASIESWAESRAFDWSEWQISVRKQFCAPRWEGSGGADTYMDLFVGLPDARVELGPDEFERLRHQEGKAGVASRKALVDCCWPEVMGRFYDALFLGMAENYTDQTEGADEPILKGELRANVVCFEEPTFEWRTVPECFQAVEDVYWLHRERKRGRSHPNHRPT